MPPVGLTSSIVYSFFFTERFQETLFAPKHRRIAVLHLLLGLTKSILKVVNFDRRGDRILVGTVPRFREGANR